MRLRQTESQLLSTLGPRHPRVVTLRSELEKRRQQMLEEAQRLHANLRNEQNIAQQRLNSIRDSVAGLQVDSGSEEHTSELQSLMRISYAVFCLKKKNTCTRQNITKQTTRHDITPSPLVTCTPTQKPVLARQRTTARHR